MKPNIIVKRSVWSCGKSIFWGILLFWLIVPLFIMIFKIIEAKNEVIEFYENKIVIKSGILSRNERQSAMTRIMAVTLNQSLLGRIFNYGNFYVDVIGNWDVNLNYIANPKELKNYLENIISYTNYNSVNQIITNH